MNKKPATTISREVDNVRAHQQVLDIALRNIVHAPPEARIEFLKQEGMKVRTASAGIRKLFDALVTLANECREERRQLRSELLRLKGDTP